MVVVPEQARKQQFSSALYCCSMSPAAAAAAALPRAENWLQYQVGPACHHAGHAEPAGHAVAC